MKFPKEENVLKFPEDFKDTIKNDSGLKQHGTFSGTTDRSSHKKKLNALALENHNQSDGTTFSISHLKSVEYSKVFWQERNSIKLISKFNLEKKELLKSSSSSLSFSVEDCKSRSLSGFYLFKYNFNSPDRKLIKLKVSEACINYSFKDKKFKRIPLSSLFGILYGGLSSTFKNFKKQVDKRYGKIHKFHHCFSLVSEFRTFDLATIKDSDRMDLCIFLSWVISLNSAAPASLPFTKRYLILRSINYKIRSAARRRYMSVVELFMVIIKQLSIYVTAKENGNCEASAKIMSMLDSHFSGLSKFSRFIMRSVLPYIEFYEDNEDQNYFRVNILLGKRLRFLKSKLMQGLEEKTFVPKNSKAYAYLVPSSKSVFQNNRSEDPALELMRQRTTKNTRSNVKHASLGDTLV